MNYIVIMSEGQFEFQNMITQYLNNGWRFVSNELRVVDGMFIRDMIKEEYEDDSIVPTEVLEDKINHMPEWAHDLLWINNISLSVQDGVMVAKDHNGKEYICPRPNTILGILKESKHCPIDLDEKQFLDEMAKVLL